MSGMLLALLAAACATLMFDRMVLRGKRERVGAAQPAPSEPALVGYARSLLPVIVIVLLFRSFLFEPFRIPSASMMPALVDGDFIVVSKFIYGLRLPIINTKLIAIRERQRGD